MLSESALVILVLLAAMFTTVSTGKLTVAAAVTGGVLGFLLFIASGYIGLVLMTTFFVAGTLSTSWQFRYKQQQGLAEENKGRRKATQVLANAGIPGLLAVLILSFRTQQQLLTVMIAAAFAAATSDTLSSELGNVYGRRYYNVLSFKKDKRGLDGVISFEGTLFGILGSSLIAAVYSIGLGFNLTTFSIITMSGVAGNVFDSFLGATLERSGFLKNDMVNFANTMFAALLALLLLML